MQESIKEVINIHKCKFFFLILYGFAGRPTWVTGLPRGPVGSLSWPAPRFFCEPAGQTLIAIPSFQTYIIFSCLLSLLLGFFKYKSIKCDTQLSTKSFSYIYFIYLVAFLKISSFKQGSRSLIGQDLNKYIIQYTKKKHEIKVVIIFFYVKLNSTGFTLYRLN